MIRTSDLLRNGITTRQIRDAVGRGVLTRIYRGTYVSSASWNVLSLHERYRQLVRAVSQASSGSLVFSHHSAAALHGLPMVSRWPESVHHLTPNAQGGSSRPFVRSHKAPPDETTVAIEGMLVTGLRRTVADLASACDFVDGVTLVDAALRRAATPSGSEVEREALLRELTALSPYRGEARARRAIAFGDHRSESAGESLSRARIAELGFEVPELQVGFAAGSQRYFVDFYWRSSHLIGEFDGRAKYSRSDMTAGRPPEEVVWREKRREDSIRSASQARFLRWTWSTAINRSAFAQMLTSGGVPRNSAGRMHRF